MQNLLIPTLLASLLSACPTGGSDPCQATFTCEPEGCTCEDGSICDDPATAAEDSASNCVNACEVCEGAE